MSRANTGPPSEVQAAIGTCRTAFISTAVFSLVINLLMLAGPLFLYLFRRRFREPLDGLAFGAASALGFTLASSLTAYWPAITGPLVSSGSPLEWGMRLARTGLLLSLINASTTALITASLWLHRYDRRRRNRGWQSGVLAAIVVAFGVQIVLAVLGFVFQDLAVQVGILAIAAATGWPANVKPWAKEASPSMNGSATLSEATSAPIGA